jgi:hypothetical protein
MRQFIYLSVLIIAAFSGYGQNSPPDQVKTPGIYLADGTKINEYKKTFEIKHLPDPDDVTLSKIDMSKYWGFMDETQRVEIVDDVTNWILVLYSREESSAFIDYRSALIVMPAGHKKDESIIKRSFQE